MAARKPSTPSSQATPLICVADGGLDKAELGEFEHKWAEANGFTGQLGRLLALPDSEGNRSSYLFGMGTPGERSPLALGLAAQGLDAGQYAITGDYGDPDLAALGFDLGTYRFAKYRDPSEPAERLPLEGANEEEVSFLKSAAFLARDLVNTPANDLGPDAYEKEIRAFASSRKMTVKSIVGDDLLKENFPLIHAVGRAAAEAPRLMELTWGPKSAPKVTLVGKGVTFDTGGLDIKPPSSMLLMKKDMGGSANILGLASAIVAAKLKLRLRVLIPVVENAISASAFRPGDVLPSRAGMNVEIGNTDAEGRLILADALSFAGEEKPEIVIDMATLTGAARVALGPELPALYSTNDDLAHDLVVAGMGIDDPMWQMPLWPSYDRLLASKIGDVNHISQGGYAGSITAALFLKRFIGETQSWVHADIFSWAAEPRPGRPQGATDQVMRAAFSVLKQRYS